MSDASSSGAEPSSDGSRAKPDGPTSSGRQVGKPRQQNQPAGQQPKSQPPDRPPNDGPPNDRPANDGPQGDGSTAQPGGSRNRRRGSRGGKRRPTRLESDAPLLDVSPAADEDSLPSRPPTRPESAKRPKARPETERTDRPRPDAAHTSKASRLSDRNPELPDVPHEGVTDSEVGLVHQLVPEGGTEKGGTEKGRTEQDRAEQPKGVSKRPPRKRGRSPQDRADRAVGRYLMCVHVQPSTTHVAVLEGRQLVEYYVSRPAESTHQIHGNIYLGRVQNVLPGMEAAFIDIGTPKNAVLYQGDVNHGSDMERIEGERGGGAATAEPSAEAKPRRIEDVLKSGQLVICQVTKNPIAQKGARLTQDVSLPGRFAVLVPNSDTSGISKRLDDGERKRLRKILEDIRPVGHGVILRTAAEGVDAEELRRDVEHLNTTWNAITKKAATSRQPTLLNSEPDLAVRVIREEFGPSYRGVIIDDRALYEEIRGYVERISPQLADRVQFHDPATENLPLFERHHVHEQLHKAIDRKVWLPSGGSIIIERTEALTVIDVNTGKNIGSTSLEETVFRNNLEAADEIARQLRLRDIGGIIVVDFIDMEIRPNREALVAAFRDALARDKTRTQVFEVSELGLVEMTRKRIGEGLVESLSDTCPTCRGRGFVLDGDLLET
jgi:ribonuclease E